MDPLSGGVLGRRPNPSTHSHILYTVNGVEPMTQTWIPTLTHKWITSPLLLWVIFFSPFFILIGVPLFFCVLCGTRKKKRQQPVCRLPTTLALGAAHREMGLPVAKAQQGTHKSDSLLYSANRSCCNFLG